MERRIIIKSVVFVSVVLAVFPSGLFAVDFRRAETLEDARAAVCRVCVSGARGSGWFAGYENDVCYIVTNFHVITKNNAARLDFWTNGKLESVNGSIVERAYDANMPADFACISVNADDLKKIDPPFLPIGGEDAKPSVGAIVVSAGAPDGRFVQAWKGMVLEYFNGKTAIFSPPPVPGQSGSPICEYVDGELFATGILTWLIGEKGRDESKGGAIPISNLYKAFKRSTGVEVDYQEGGDPIPPDASECAETLASAPCVVMLTQENCPPCKEAQKDVAELREKKIPVYVYDVASEYGAQLAQRFKADRTPTFFVLDKKYAPVGRFVGAGVASQVAAAFAELVDESCPIRDGAQSLGSQYAGGRPVETEIAHAADSSGRSLATVPLPTGGPPQEATNGSDYFTNRAASAKREPSLSAAADSSGRSLATVPLPTGGPPQQATNGSEYDRPVARLARIGVQRPTAGSGPAEPDFRSRPAVYDVTSNVGFLEDSNERWLNRGRKDEPKTEPEKKPKLGDRLTDSVVDSIVGRVSSELEKKGATMKDNAIKAWETVRLSVFMAFVALVVVAVLIAQALASGFRWLWRKSLVFTRNFRAFLKDAQTDD